MLLENIFQERSVCVIANDIRSLHNVGSIFRSCDAFGVERLYLTGISGTPPRKEIAKVSLGSEHRVAWEYQEGVLALINELKTRGVKIVALENGQGSVDINSFKFKDKIALVIGNEVAGVSPEILDMCDAQVEIPMLAAKKSLNVSVAFGIALFALGQKND
jgi:tRNA G18 (ribose-2'-O)-methylase SpoU